MLYTISNSSASFLFLLSLCAFRYNAFLIHTLSAQTYFARLGNAINATVDLSEMAANGSTTADGASPYKIGSGGEILPTQYLTNVENWMFGDTDTANTVKQRFQSLADNVNWAFDTDQNSEDPIMITVGADYLELKTGADGVSRWYDPWHDIYESTADDADIIACRAQGPYQGRTVMAVLRDIRVTNYPNAERWVIHICKSALIEQRYQTGVPQVTIDLLDVTRNMIYLAPKLYEKMSTSVWSQFYIDSFRWIDYILLNALLNIRQVEDSEASSSDTSTAITDYSPWDDCLDTQTETIDCQALYAVAANLYYNGIAVDKNGLLGIYSL